MAAGSRKIIATYSDTSKTLHVTPKAFDLLDEIVVTNMIHLWRRNRGVDWKE
jgi:hypothetical protein